MPIELPVSGFETAFFGPNPESLKTGGVYYSFRVWRPYWLSILLIWRNMLVLPGRLGFWGAGSDFCVGK